MASIITAIAAKGGGLSIIQITGTVAAVDQGQRSMLDGRALGALLRERLPDRTIQILVEALTEERKGDK